LETQLVEEGKYMTQRSTRWTGSVKVNFPLPKVWPRRVKYVPNNEKKHPYIRYLLDNVMVHDYRAWVCEQFRKDLEMKDVSLLSSEEQAIVAQEVLVSLVTHINSIAQADFRWSERGHNIVLRPLQGEHPTDILSFFPHVVFIGGSMDSPQDNRIIRTSSGYFIVTNHDVRVVVRTESEENKHIFSGRRIIEVSNPHQYEIDEFISEGIPPQRR
jgi:hypothetical protein